MKKYLWIIVAIVTIYSCQKKESETVALTQDVVFAAEWVDPGNLKSTEDFPCQNLSADYAWVKIIVNNVEEDFYPTVYSVGNKIYTQTVKMPVPSGGNEICYVSQFCIMHDNPNPGHGTEDVVVMATPETGSTFEPFVNQCVQFPFTVSAFAKSEVPVQVLCFRTQDYSNFGFDWFAVDQIVIREQCFFGDICLNGPSDYNTPNNFASDEYGYDLGIDVPALMRIRVEQGGEPVPNSPFYNISWKGFGEPLCIQYPDNLNIDNELNRIFLDVLVADDQGDMVYLNYAEFTITDDGPLMYNNDEIVGTDNVLDFVIGDCNYPGADINFLWPSVLNAWVNELHYDNAGGDVGEFIEVVIENPGNYSLSDFAVVFYNGANGTSYATKTLDLFTVGTTEGNFTFYTYSLTGIQNGSPDGFAFSYQGAVIAGQFLSYEGAFTAVVGPADGMTSTDIGVVENGAGPIGQSLQLSGTASSYSGFVWNAPASETPGALNNNQTFW